MRLFIGLQPADEFRNALSAAQDSLRDAGVAGRYADPSGLHLTLAFVGSWPEDISGILPPVEKPFPLTLSGFGVFPGAGVLWAGTAPSAALDRLALRVRSALSSAGIPFDPKPFFPHITLARKPVLPEGLRLSEIRIPAASMTVRDVCLYRSERGVNGMVYSVAGRGPGPGDRYPADREYSSGGCGR